MAADEHYYVDGPLPETPLSPADGVPWTDTRVVGARQPRIDGYERVSGSAIYPSDLVLPGMLYAVILRSPHPHARVVEVDAARATTMPGVHAVLTRANPEAQLEFAYRGGVTTALLDEHIRHEGEEVAAVVAETPYQAHDALAAVDVEYEVLEPVTDERDALAPGAAMVHDGGNQVSEPSTSERGDVEKGFAEADVVLENTYSTPCEIHAPMEVHGCVARWDGDRLTLWESSQGVYAVQSTVARVLGLPLCNVRVVGHYMGGGFGAKLQAGKYTLIAAVLARMTARPVKLFLSREESFLCVGNRPPAHMTLKAGVKKDGTLTALELTGLGTGGAYPAGGTSLLDWLVRDLYAVANVRTTTTDVYVNAGPARPMRAPGHPQCAWALEQMMDALADAIDMDPVELRLRNVPTASQARGGPPYTTTGLAECLARGAEAFGWQAARARPPGSGHLRRGVGMASCVWIAGGGGPPSTVIVKLFADGSANLNMGASDLGTGTKTVMAMVVAEELGIALDRIQIEHADTATTQFATPSGGSKTVPTESPAVRAAALEVKRQLLAIAADELGVEPEQVMLADGEVFGRATPDQRTPIGRLGGFRKRGVLVGVGYRGPNPEGKVVNPFAAQLCEVEVNTRTGEVRLLRFLGAHDSGRVLNRLTYDNQVFGGIMMGIGFGLTEERVLDRGQTGRMLNNNLHDYKIPTAMDTPLAVASLPVDLGDTEANSTGAKGLGEPVTIPTAAAIANAVFHATGVRVTDAPITPARLCQLLAEQQPASKEG